MRSLASWLTPFFATALVLAASGRAGAERAVFHFAPTGPGGALQLVPAADGIAGERTGSFGKLRGSICEPPRPTCNVTFKHPHTGQEVTVPLALPDSTPIIEHAWGRIVYDYGSYTVTVRFLADGGVDVVYNSGLLRPLVFPTSPSVPTTVAAPAALPPALPPPAKLD